MTCSVPGEATLTVGPDESGGDFLQRLRKNLTQLGQAALPDGYDLPFAGGLIGYLSYDFGRHLEQVSHLAVDDLHLPDARFGLYAWALVSDHQVQTSQLVFHPALADGEQQRLINVFSQAQNDAPTTFKLHGPMVPDLSAEAYHQAIIRIRITSRPATATRSTLPSFRAPCIGDPWAAYCALREACRRRFPGSRVCPMTARC